LNPNTDNPFRGIGSICFQLFPNWGDNRILSYCQGGVFPAIARLLIVWFPTRTRGSYWSVVSMASNVGYGALPVLVAMAMDRVGSWRVAFMLPGPRPGSPPPR
jgi:hypothetical protein